MTDPTTFLSSVMADGSSLPTESPRLDFPGRVPLGPDDTRGCDLCGESGRAALVVDTVSGERWLLLCGKHFVPVAKAKEKAEVAHMARVLRRLKDYPTSLPVVPRWSDRSQLGALISARAAEKHPCYVCTSEAVSSLVVHSAGDWWLDLCPRHHGVAVKADEEVNG